MTLNKMQLDAIPAPLRIFPKDPNRTVHPELRATRCHALAKLPSQPVFGNSDASEHDNSQILKACQCLKSPISPLLSPIIPQDTSMNKSQPPSLDFSALFMKSPTLRKELERCTCQHTAELEPVSISPTRELDQVDTSSIVSGYTSIYSR